MLTSTHILWLIVASFFLGILLWNVRAFFVRIAGVWYEKKEDASAILEIRLRQIGPLVWGSSVVDGGMMRYLGWFDGQWLTLKRRDFGYPYLRRLGFPDAVLLELDGSEMVRLRLRYDAHNKALHGEHFPQKIDVSHTKPPKILSRVYLPSKPKTWTRSV